MHKRKTWACAVLAISLGGSYSCATRNSSSAALPTASTTAPTLIDTPGEQDVPVSQEPLPTFGSLGERQLAISLDSSLADADMKALIEANPEVRSCYDTLTRAQWDQDYFHPLDAALHFDNCAIPAGLSYARSEYQKANAAASSGKALAALRHLGHVLHSVVDFYAHTNFVERHVEGKLSFDDVPDVDLWIPSTDAQLESLSLLSGRTFISALVASTECPLTHGQLNKDDEGSSAGGKPITSWSKTYYGATLELTRAAIERLVRSTLAQPSWEPVRKKCGRRYGVGILSDRRDQHDAGG